MTIFINKVLFAFKDDFVLGVKGVADRHHLAFEVGVRWKSTGFKPSSAGTIHGSAVVGVLLAGVAPDGVVDNVFAAELDFVAEQALGSDLVDHATADTTTVDHDAVGMVLVIDVDDFAGELGCGIAVIAEAINGTCVAALAGEDDRGVHAEASNVNAKGERLDSVYVDFTGHGFVDGGCGEEFHQAFAGELAENANSNEIGVEAIGINPALQALFVSDSDVATIDLEVVPLISELTSREAITETTDVSCGVSKGKPDDFCVGIGKSAFCGFPDYVGDFGGFVED